MKDIRSLKLWPILQQEGFTIKEYRSNNILYGRGAILLPDYKAGFPYIEIQPLNNGRWKITADYFSHSSSQESTPADIQRNILPKYLQEFKAYNIGQSPTLQSGE